MGKIIVLRPFQSAMKIAKESGLDHRETFREIHQIQQDGSGHLGNKAVGKLREKAQSYYRPPSEKED